MSRLITNSIYSRGLCIGRIYLRNRRFWAILTHSVGDCTFEFYGNPLARHHIRHLPLLFVAVKKWKHVFWNSTNSECFFINQKNKSHRTSICLPIFYLFVSNYTRQVEYTDTNVTLLELVTSDSKMSFFRKFFGGKKK